MANWTQLGGDPVPAEVAPVLGLARVLRASARDLQQWRSRARGLFSGIGTVWSGRAATAYGRAGLALAEAGVGWQRRQEAAAAVLVEFAGQLQSLHDEAAELALRAASYQADLQSLQVAEWYSLRLGIGRPAGAAEQASALQVRLTAVRHRIDQLRADYATAEGRVVAAIGALVGVLELAVPGAVLSAAEQAVLASLAAAGATGDYQRFGQLLAGLTTGQVSALFADLDPAVAAELARADPAGLGNLDGVPLADRAIANQLLAERDRAAALVSGDSARVRLLDQLLGSGGSLVCYQPAADRYGVLFGSQHATHLAVLVPGVGGDPNLGGWLDDAYAVWARSPDSAVIMWKGYHDPGSNGLFPDAAAAAFNGRAAAGAHDLVRFTDGLARRPDQTLTIVAHSYGSVLTGIALARDGLAPTNVVALGSPGMSVDNVGQLHLAQGQFFDEKAPGDPVANWLGGMGADPSTAAFGGTRLATNGAGLPAVSGHSQYFGRSSQALDGISHVITGQVSSADVQQPSAGQQVGVASRLAINPLQSQLDTLARDYDGPGANRLQLLDHLAGGVGSGVQTGVTNLVDSPGSTIRAVSHFLLW